MKKLLFLLAFLLSIASGYAQVGINTTTPDAQLDIKSSNQATPTNTDGILIPKIDAFPVTNPTAAQNSMMVYLTTTSAGKSPGFYYWDNATTSWKGFGNGSGWSLTGNTGTTPGTNFIGTTDDKPLIFKTNNIQSGYLGGSDNYAVFFGHRAGEINAGFWNVGIGSYALNLNTWGSSNVAIGQLALNKNTTGYSNFALGTVAMNDNTIGNNNVAIGEHTLDKNVTGSYAVAIGSYAMQYSNDTTTAFDNHNVAIGYQSLMGSTTPANNTGNSNTAVGYQSMNKNTTGSFNASLGEGTLFENTTGGSNLAFGYYALSKNTQGNNNSAIGGLSMEKNTLGNDNVGIGTFSLQSNIDGDQNTAIGRSSLVGNSTGNNNIAIGVNALIASKAGSNATAIGTGAMQNANSTTTAFDNKNVAIGFEALKGSTTPANNTGNNNTALGYQTLTVNTSGNNNLAFGVEALKQNTTGSSNIAIGNTTLSGNTTGSNNIAIGNNANVNTINGSNQLSINNVVYGINMNNLATAPANISIGTTPYVKYRFYNYNNQVTTNGDGQYGLFSYRTRDTQNDGISYAFGNTNAANVGYNFWGDLYTFGTVGYSYNDFTRTGGVLGSNVGGTYWSSLGYVSSATTTYGIYASAAGYAQGAGRMAQPTTEFSIGGGFYGGLIGSWSRGNLIGQISSGTLFASYNRGDEYTSGKQIELVDTGTSKTPAYTVTSTESIIYKKGKINLINGVAKVEFDENYKDLLGEIPVITTTPMGQCNGVYIESVNKNGFTIRELSNGISNVAISWIAVGDRIDVRKLVSRDVLSQDFDSNINEVMFNENNKEESAKGIWSDGNKINFGQLPANLIDKPEKDKK